MTVNEAAKKIGISTSKLYQLVSTRQIAHYRVGGKIIFSDEDVIAYLESCHVGTAKWQAAVPTRNLQLKHVILP